MLRLFRHYVPLPTIAFAAVELLFLFWSFYVYHSRAARSFGIESGSVTLSAAFAFSVFVMMFSLGLYSRVIFVRRREMAMRIVLCFCFVAPLFIGGVAIASPYLAQPLPWSHENFLPGMLFGLFAITGTRFLILPMINVGALKRRVLVIGVGDFARRIEQLVAANANRGFLVVDYLRVANEAPRIRSNYIDHRRSLGGRSIAQIADEKFVDEIVVALRDRRGLPTEDLLDCKLGGINVSEYLTFWERETGKIDLEALNPSWLFYSDGFRTNLYTNLVKRLFDIVVSLIALAATLPIIALIAATIRLEGSGPIFYAQERVGLNGRRFRLMKFRSMSVNAETDGVPVWAAANDQRITRIGALIRKTRIDEIPQVFNVLRGDMSFIGPRPERPFFVETLMKEIPYYNERHRVKPGISGWAQINYPYGASVEDAREKLTYDLYYVKNRSLFLDLVILLPTARVVLWPEGVR
jgi:sugar transferase (PEP-CTERM system associated)